MSGLENKDTKGYSPYFSNQIIDVVPGNRGVSDSTPPAHQVAWSDVGVGVEVVCDWYLGVLERRSDEADMEVWVSVKGGLWGYGW